MALRKHTRNLTYARFCDFQLINKRRVTTTTTANGNDLTNNERKQIHFQRVNIG